MTVDSNNKCMPNAFVPSSNGCFYQELRFNGIDVWGVWNETLPNSFGT